MFNDIQNLQPITLVQAPVPRVSSSDASKRTISRRTSMLSSIRELTSGGDSSSQLAAEIKALSKVDREALLQQASLPLVIPPSHALAIKADLQIQCTFPSEGGEVIREVPFVYFPNLMMVIGDLVEKHERYGKLVIGILIQTNFTWQSLSRIDMA